MSKKPRGKNALASVQRTDRTRTILIQVGVAVVLIGLIAAIGISIAVRNAEKNDPGPTPTIAAPPAPDGLTASLTDNGSIRLGKPGAKATVRVVADLQCPACQAFEVTDGKVIEEAVASGKAAVEYNIIAMLDQQSGGNTRYSSRAASAAYCVAGSDPSKFQGWLTSMFQQQPREGAGGLPDDKLVQIAKDAGYTDPAVAQCITDRKYQKYSMRITDKVLDSGIVQTPTIFINGNQVSGNDLAPDNFRQKIEAAAK
ncbi:DsbA family protein [Nocardia sp. CDC159]|uniref:DsbA family protein n=1 Tax=Nocardia pulmonis TaxID=2951408 RepID=A0A9X2EB10_9NOCA|nr:MULTISPECIES: thioredoxin domain-containing protein [Nocardia]MCM6774823.1 DsbA family protein [Nocardia pulmonis]MCM6789754.1 DsbA family protein [Nocardia sp. CDC159]